MATTPGSDNQVEVLLTADYSNLQEGMQRGAESVAASSSEIRDTLAEQTTNFESASAYFEAMMDEQMAAAAAMSASVLSSVVTLSQGVQDSAAVVIGGSVAEVEAMNSVTIAATAKAHAVTYSIAEQVAAIKTLDAIRAKSITTIAGLAEAESALDILQKGNLITQAEVTSSLNTLNAAQAQINRAAILQADGITEASAAEAAALDSVTISSKAATVAIAGETAALEANTGEKVINAGVTRELSVMTGELLRGNYTRLIGSTTVLANRTGLMSKLFTAQGAAIGALVAVGAGYVYQTFEAEKAQSQLNSALLLSNYSSGLSLDATLELRDGLHAVTGDMNASNQAMIAMIQSGRFTAEELFSVGRASVEMSRMTGESVAKCVSEFDKLRDDPVKAVIALNKEYHFLTVAVFDQINALAKQGDAEAAAKVGIDAFANSIHQAALREEEDAGSVLKAWRETAAFFSNVKGMIAEQGTQESITRALQDKRDALEATISSVKSGNWNMQFSADNAQNERELDALNKQITALKGVASARADAAAKGKTEGEHVQRVIEETQAQEKYIAKLKDTENLEAQITLRRQAAEKLHKDDPNAPSLKGFDFDASGALTGGKAWAEELKEVTKQYSHIKDGAAAARKAAREAASEATVGLQQQREQIKASGGEMQRIDQQLVDSAAKRYGENSTQHRAALAQQLADQKAYTGEAIKEVKHEVDAEIAARKAVAEAARTLALDEIQTKQQQYQNEFAEGQISAAQLRALEYKLADDKEAAEIAYYEALKRLAIGNVAALAKLNGDEAAAHQKMLDDKAKADKRYLQQLQKDYKQTSQNIAQSMTGAFQSMVFHQQTAKQAMLSLAESFASQIIDIEVTQPLARYIEGLLIKRAQTSASDASTATEKNTMRATDAAADAAASMASVIRASGVAGAEGTASFAGAPWPIDMGAPAFGAGMAAAALAFGSVASASRGWGNVPYDDMPTLLHKNEMVLPAPIAKKVRDGAGGGAIYVSAMDARSMRDSFRRNPAAFAAGARRAARLGHVR